MLLLPLVRRSTDPKDLAQQRHNQRKRIFFTTKDTKFTKVKKQFSENFVPFVPPSKRGCCPPTDEKNPAQHSLFLPLDGEGRRKG
jgi:hypothetical protein